jgi:hypothetical protein
MTTGRINQVASLQEKVRIARSRIPSSGYAPRRGRRGSRDDGGTPVQDHASRNRFFAFCSGSALTTSPTASTPRGLHSWASRERCVGRRGRKPEVRTRFCSARLRHHGRASARRAEKVLGCRRARGTRRKSPRRPGNRESQASPKHAKPCDRQRRNGSDSRSRRSGGRQRHQTNANRESS